MGFEPTTPTLARLCSTPELRPRSVEAVSMRVTFGLQAHTGRAAMRQPLYLKPGFSAPRACAMHFMDGAHVKGLGLPRSAL